MRIYLVTGDIIPVQIIESKRLSESENLWLKGLTNDLKIEAADILEEMSDETMTLEDVLEEAGLVAKWEARAEVKGWKKALELMKKGYTLEQLEKMAPNETPPAKP
jgi:hypothetical protein